MKIKADVEVGNMGRHYIVLLPLLEIGWMRPQKRFGISIEWLWYKAGVYIWKSK